LLKVQFAELAMDCATYKKNYEDALTEIALLKVEQEKAISELNQFCQSISSKLTDILISEGLTDSIVQ
jgi:hypothetical protein